MRIEKLIDSMQRRPGMYLLEERIDYIFHFLLGYCGANSDFLEDDNMDRRFCSWFWKWLLIWIEDNVDSEYQIKSACWYEDIRKIAGDEQKAVTLFYDLCKMFFEDYKEKRGYFSWRNDSEE